MSDYFHRQVELWGQKKQDSLKSRSVAIIGSGGLGCSIALALSGSGIREFFLVDFDKVELHNIHRQLAFDMQDQGKEKAQVLANLVESRSDFCKATPYIEDFNSFSKKDIIPDLIIDATDNLQARSDIDKFCKKHNIPWIYGSVEEFNAQVCFFDKSDFSSFKINDKKPKGIAAPMVMQVAATQANMALRYLVDLPVKKDELNYIYYDDEGSLIMKKFQMPKV